jgi:hypothetical protein
VNRVTQPIGRIDPDIKHPRVDEWSLGLERQFGQNWRFSATGHLPRQQELHGQRAPGRALDASSLTSTQSPTVEGCDDCSALSPTTVTGYRWANRSSSANNLLVTNPDGFSTSTRRPRARDR